jgi:GDPmannose 4,6-dehydratase
MGGTALITGITGQDGSYLAERLLADGWTVHGVVRPGRSLMKGHLAGLEGRAILHPADLSDRAALFEIVRVAAPDELYHLGGQSQPGLSFKEPLRTTELNALGTLHLLDACRAAGFRPRFFHASSSQIFGRSTAAPQNEDTPVKPVSPYAASKAFASDLVRIARETEGWYAVNGILFNHESPRRPPEFVTAKICRTAAAIRRGEARELVLGDTTARRDWSDARDFVEGFILSLRASEPGDYVFGSGVEHTVQDVVEAAFGAVGLDWRSHLRTDPALLRPAEPSRLVADTAKAGRVLGWSPRTPFAQLIAEMTMAALEGR